MEEIGAAEEISLTWSKPSETFLIEDATELHYFRSDKLDKPTGRLLVSFLSALPFST